MQRVVEAPTAPDERARLGLDRGEMARMELVAAGAGYLGLEVAELEARLEDGESMGEIAIKRGRSIQGLFDVLLVTCRRRLPWDLPQEALLHAVEGAIVGPRPAEHPRSYLAAA
ncbi:MAG TPA: hypothetical protein VKD47_09340 [Miltoncostaeaceae bacterium]|nr:hypothetical protein [Miltoncostaeaceae bacterium]